MAFQPLGKPTEFASSRGHKVALRRWDVKEPKAVLLIVHGGAGWHSGYFDLLGKALQAKSFAAVAYDQVPRALESTMRAG